jgi:hypothetical protein
MKKARIEAWRLRLIFLLTSCLLRIHRVFEEKADELKQETGSMERRCGAVAAPALISDRPPANGSQAILRTVLLLQWL